MFSTFAGLSGDRFLWMVKGNESWFHLQHSSWQLPKLNCMSTLLESRQRQCLPSLTNHDTCSFPTHVALPGCTDPALQRLNNEQINEAHRLLQCLPPHLRASLPAPNPFDGKQSAFSCGPEKSAVPNTNSVSCQRGFLIFDQSENHTRLIYNSVFPPIKNPSFATAKLNCNYDDLYKVGQAGRVDQSGPTKYVPYEVSGKNHMANEESEMHEDTEEINALLYSDDDDDDDDDDDNNGDDDYSEDDDEVRSTGNSPLGIKESNGNQEVEVLTKEVTSYDGPNKRQKLLNGGYSKSSPTDTASSVKLDRSHEYGNDVESGYAGSHNPGEESGCIFGKMWSKKEKIREILEVLESIIPGAKGKDALIVIDEAIHYLKTMKLKAENLGTRFH